MPTYQYTCRDCGEPLEVVQSFSDDALTECPACRGELRKVFSAVGIVFKGAGFYRNDSRASEGAKSSGSNGDGDKKSTESGSDSSTSSSSSSDSSSESTSSTASKSKTKETASTT